MSVDSSISGIDSSISDIDKPKVLDPDEAFVKILEYISNHFYKKPNQTTDISISLSDTDNSFDVDKDKMYLSKTQLEMFTNLNLPRFLLYYHELGHYLYTKESCSVLVDKWVRINNGPLQWKPKYMHLINWIEDFYVEERLKTEHKYLRDVMTCIKKLTPDYDVTVIEHAFSYYYLYSAVTPALQYLDQLTFKGYIDKLLSMRGTQYHKFGQGVLTNVSIKQSIETQYAYLIIEFYEWCVQKKIFTKELPPLSHPSNTFDTDDTDGNSTAGDTDGDGNADDGDSDYAEYDPDKDHNVKGSNSPHSRLVGKVGGVHERAIINAPTDLFKQDLVAEDKMITREIINSTSVVQSDKFTLDGLFATTYKDSCIIQPKVNIQNFFNPNRLIDGNLFKEKLHSYMNVAIFRDISGSTHSNMPGSNMSIHGAMHHICELLMEEIPVNISYYLYSSGDISIIQMPYIPWYDSRKAPAEYLKNKLFKKLDGGTNSSAIADAITEQLSDKWLNIIITDGDLTDLMKRDNIYGLLKNVFVISVGAKLNWDLKCISINSIYDINNIVPAISSINIDN